MQRTQSTWDPMDGVMMAATMLDFSTPHLRRNAKEYKVAVVEIGRLLDADPKGGTEACDRLDFLSVLVQAYEDERDPSDERGGSPCPRNS